MVAAVALPELGFALSLPTEERSLGPSLTGEAAWTRSAARGDREAFARLVDLHKRAVYGLCLRLLRHPEEARDAAQEAFARAFAGLSVYDPSQPFAPWLLRIARNHCLDQLRLRKRRPSIPLDVYNEYDEEIESPAWVVDPGDTPEEALERADSQAAIYQGIRQLAPKYRLAIELVDLQQMDYQDAAAVMGIPLGTLKSQVSRARIQLRGALLNNPRFARQAFARL